MKSRAILQYALAAVSGFLALVAVWIFVQEYESYDLQQNWQTTQFVERGFADLPKALSVQSDRNIIEGCLGTLTSLEGRLMRVDTRAQLFESCRNIVGNIMSSSQNDPYGWYVLAFINLDLGLWDQFETALQKSYEYGPSEQWLAELRVPIAESAISQLSAKTLQGHFSDLELLVQSRRGIDTIALRYAREPQFRERIVSIVETLPQEVQKRFLRYVKREVREEFDDH